MSLDRAYRPATPTSAAAAFVLDAAALTLPAREQPVVPDLHEPLRQHVLHEPTQEFFGRQRQQFFFAGIRVVVVAEGHPPVGQLHQPMVADGHAVRVTRQVLQHLRRSGDPKGQLGQLEALLSLPLKQVNVVSAQARRAGAVTPAGASAVRESLLAEVAHGRLRRAGATTTAGASARPDCRQPFAHYFNSAAAVKPRRPPVSMIPAPASGVPSIRPRR